MVNASLEPGAYAGPGDNLRISQGLVFPNSSAWHPVRLPRGSRIATQNLGTDRANQLLSGFCITLVGLEKRRPYLFQAGGCSNPAGKCPTEGGTDSPVCLLFAADRGGLTSVAHDGVPLFRLQLLRSAS